MIAKVAQSASGQRSVDLTWRRKERIDLGGLASLSSSWQVGREAWAARVRELTPEVHGVDAGGAGRASWRRGGAAREGGPAWRGRRYRRRGSPARITEPPLRHTLRPVAPKCLLRAGVPVEAPWVLAVIATPA